MGAWEPDGNGWVEGDAPHTLDYEEVTYRRPILGTLRTWHRRLERSDLDRSADTIQVISDTLLTEEYPDQGKKI